MTTELKPEIAARVAELAERLGITGADAGERVLKLAPDGLECKTPRPHRKMTPEEIAAEYRQISAAGRRWREEHPDQYEENYPPSLAWQDELYDEQGLPK